MYNLRHYSTPLKTHKVSPIMPESATKIELLIQNAKSKMQNYLADALIVGKLASLGSLMSLGDLRSLGNLGNLGSLGKLRESP